MDIGWMRILPKDVSSGSAKFRVGLLILKVTGVILSIRW